MIDVARQDAGPIVVVVDDAAMAAELRRAGRCEVVEVDHYLAALGEMGAGRVVAVVGRYEAMASSPDATVRALRDLSPTARVLLTAEAADEPAARRAVRLGCDDYFVRPLRAGQLVEALGLRSTGGAPAATEASDEDEASDDAPHAAEDQATLEAAGDAQPLSEVDLIQQVLRDRAELRPLALRVIRQRLGGEDVDFAPEASSERRACVAVRCGEAVEGYLVSDTFDESALAEQAAWLGHWVALQKQIDEHADQALRDELTGLRNRRYFDRFFADVIEQAKQQRFRVTLMLYDIDDFKDYNDQYGHPAGDEILREAAKLMQSLVRKQDVVARVGGDEFAVIFWDAEPKRRSESEHPSSVRSTAARFQKAICEHRFPKLAELAPGTLTISGGMASFPWDGQTPEQLVALADRMLLTSKRQGKNAITFGPGATKACEVEAEAPEQAEAEEQDGDG